MWLHQQLLIVTSNNWSQELEKLNPSDREWIEANSLHKVITFQLWVDEPRPCVSTPTTRYLPAEEDLVAFLEEEPVRPAAVDEFDEEDVFGYGSAGLDE